MVCRLRFRTASQGGETGTRISWTVVTEGQGDDDLLQAFAHQALHDPLTDLPTRALLDLQGWEAEDIFAHS